MYTMPLWFFVFEQVGVQSSYEIVHIGFVQVESAVGLWQIEVEKEEDLVTLYFKFRIIF